MRGAALLELRLEPNASDKTVPVRLTGRTAQQCVPGHVRVSKQIDLQLARASLGR